MRASIALVVLAVVATVAVLALAIDRTHDDVPGDLRGCIEDSGGQLVRGSDVLGSLRTDLSNETGPELVEEVEVGGNDGVLYEGTGYRLLVVTGRGNPPLDEETPMRVFEDATVYGVVALERDPVEGALRACAETTG